MLPYRLVPMVALILIATHAQAVEYGKVLPEQSRITFTSKQMGAAMDGQFDKFTADVSFDPARPEAGRALIEVQVASVDAGNRDANDEVKSKGWFNVREFPTANFVADAGGVRSLGDNRFEARGKMSIKGKTRDVVVPFQYKADGANAVLEGSIPIQRTQYGIGAGAWADTSVVADEVPIKFRLIVAPK
ncbi:MAG TPA: YceI family protein [Burkholderiales bacterium]